MKFTRPYCSATALCGLLTFAAVLAATPAQAATTDISCQTNSGNSSTVYSYHIDFSASTVNSSRSGNDPAYTATVAVTATSLDWSSDRVRTWHLDRNTGHMTMSMSNGAGLYVSTDYVCQGANGL